MNPDNPTPRRRRLSHARPVDFADCRIAATRRAAAALSGAGHAELQRWFDQSRKLEVMFLVWLAMWFVTIVFVVAEADKILGWILIGAVTVRFVCCIWRTKLVAGTCSSSMRC